MILLLQYRTDVSGPHEVACFYDILKSKLSYNQYFILNMSSPKITQGMVEDFIAKSDGVILGGLAEGGFEDLNNPKIPEKQKQRFLKTVELTSPIVQNLIKENKPTLAICFGHQLVLKELGAKLSFDLQYQETGIYEIYLTPEAKQDRLFKNMPDSFGAVLGHKTSVIKLPENPQYPIVHLAKSEKTPIQAVRIGKSFYSTQFHPELTRQGLIDRLHQYPSYLKANPNAIKKIPDIKVEANKLLLNWADFVEQNQI